MRRSCPSQSTLPLSPSILHSNPFTKMATVIATSTKQAAVSRKATVNKSETQAFSVGPDGDDQFFWAYTEEPHRTRRQAIIKKHPEVGGMNPERRLYSANSCSQVLKLCGPEPLTIPLVLGVVSLQCLCAYLLRNSAFFSWPFFLTAYIIGATANQNLFLAIHEISHNLAFRKPLANRLFAMVANLPIGIPYSASFRVCRSRKKNNGTRLTGHVAIPPYPPQVSWR